MPKGAPEAQKQEFEYELAEGNTATWKDGKWTINKPDAS
jgi:hypothetical protein